MSEKFGKDGRLYHRTGDRWIPVQTADFSSKLPNTEERKITHRASAQRAGQKLVHSLPHNMTTERSTLTPLSIVYRPKRHVQHSTRSVFDFWKLDRFTVGRVLFWIGVSGSVISGLVLVVTLIILLGPVWKFFLFFLSALIFFVVMTILSIGMMKAPEREK
ncbi:MAG TPA: hypothetical protein VLG12_03250 [Candidatus Saccharimonadales bacterium]|nr:hypothetical protein [Candidatus Saccharimonadales bacterium]